MSKDNLELLSYTKIAEMYLKENKKTMNTADLFREVCKLLELGDDEAHIFHIPIPEYALALNEDKVAMVGTCKESPCVSALNSGMFTAIKEQGDIMGVFCGHDHDNDFAIMYHNVLLAYGRYSGGNTVYNHLGENGARVIVLTENERRFKTWIRLRGGEVIHEAVYPDSFIKNKKKNKPK